MTLKFESENHTKPHFQGDWLALKTVSANQSTGAIDMLKRDRFELLSAYLDGEVTAAERREVEDWLANDPAVQCLYARLLKLRQGLRTLPVPPAQQPVEQTIQQVYSRLNRRRQIAVVGGGAAIAALFIGALSGVLPPRQSIAPQLAQSSEPAVVPGELLMVALNTPVMEIPTAPSSAIEKAVKPTQSRQQLTN